MASLFNTTARRLCAPEQLLRLALKPPVRPQLGSPYPQLYGSRLQGSARRGFRCDVSRRAAPETESKTTSGEERGGISHGNTTRNGGETVFSKSYSRYGGKKYQDGGDQHRKHASTSKPLAILAGGGVLSLLFTVTTTKAEKDVPSSLQSPAQPQVTDTRDPSLPRFRLTDIRKHDASSPNPWVTSGDKVYDITDWVAAHPGGDVILRAAGHSIDPYWAIFTIHKAPHVREILEQYCIGFVDIADLEAGKPRVGAGDEVEDPFSDDPVRDERMLMHTMRPANGEPPPADLTNSWLTPKELFYVRHHMWVPKIDPAVADQHVLTVELPDGEERKYTLAELKERFRMHTVTAALQCSGNRRSDMTRQVAKTDGLPWGVGAISNATWEGILLADVLKDAGLKRETNTNETADEPSEDDMHVQFSSLEAYGASIPLPTALSRSSSVLLAFRMNGETLPPDHGYPIRAIVPGHVAARSVKWLSKVVVSDEESPTQWQRRDYKCFGPNEGVAKKEDWEAAKSIQVMPVTSAVTGIWLGEKECSGQKWMIGGDGEKGDSTSKRGPSGVRDAKPWAQTHMKDSPSSKSEPVGLTGYAYSGGGKAIVRVDVSVDGGRTWDQAELLPDGEDGLGAKARGGKTFSWRRWRYAGKLTDLPEKGKACTEIIVKATDEAYNTQPEHHSSIYNVRGNLATAWHRVKVCSTCDGGLSAPALRTKTVEGCGFDTKKK